jgi:hypothetical protein
MPAPRDVLILINGDTALVTAVDSCGAIGNLPHDALSVRPEIVGEFTARTALLEVAAAGAVPSFASVSVSNAPQTAELLLAGVRAVLGSLPLVVSTEKNMPTAMTALGVTVTGSCPKGALRLGQARPGDLLWCAGVPRVGAEALAADAVLPSPELVTMLFQTPGVHAMIPVGSRGVAAEAEVLAAESGLSAALRPDAGVDLYRSAGPSSCLLFAAAREYAPRRLPRTAPPSANFAEGEQSGGFVSRSLSRESFSDRETGPLPKQSFRFSLCADNFQNPLQSLRLRCYDKKVPASGAAAARNPRPFRKQDLCKRKEVSDDTL